ncbi:MAG: hypothetical protein D6813_04320 [Calditrichaeota bacterium]|nr:MAG: hypothetical protein D6813_04320 [Calditrichota bacterium]
MSLLRELQNITERTYQQNSGINLEHFIIGKQRFRDLSQYCTPEARELSHLARVFFRVLNGRLYMAIYYSDEVISYLEQNDPRMGLSEKNIYPFVVFFEELNHAVHAALKFLAGEKDIHKEEFIRDLELMARIDTYQILKLFLAYFNKSKKLERFDRLWLRYHLFERNDYSYESPRLAHRYREINWLSEKYTRFLDALQPAHRVDELRRFREFPYPVKKRYIEMLP